MERLFDADKPHFATWLWIYNEDSGHSMYTMRPEEPEAVPLYYAARLRFRDLAERLIVEHPEHVNARGGVWETPMHAAVITDDVNILSLLIEHGADMEDQSRTSLNHAASYGRVQIGQYLLDRGANINTRNDLRNTPLINAVSYGHIEFARMLLERGAVIDAQGYYRKTALHCAINGRFTQAVQLLLEHGADVNVRHYKGNTASELASLRGHQEIVELISAYSAESVKK
jgi:ankyrin repeat protein